MGRVREIGSLQDVIEISRRCGWVRPVIDFAHLHATSDGAYTDGRAVRGRARGRRRGARAGRAVPHPLLGHRLREPQRDQAPALRRGHAPRRAAAQGVAEVPAGRPPSSPSRRTEVGSTSGDHRVVRSPERGLARRCRPPRGRPRGARRARPPRPRGRAHEGTEPALAGARTGASRCSVSARSSSYAWRSSSSASSSRPCAARTRPSDIVVVARELTSCGPTVSRAARAKRSASSIAALREQELRERALRLAERRRGPRAARGCGSTRGRAARSRARSPLCRAVHAAKFSVRPSDPRGARLGEVLARRLERGLGIVELAPVRCSWPAKRSALPTRLGAAALLGKQDRLLDQRLGAVELEPREVDARELVGGLALEALAPGRPRELERLEHHTAPPSARSPRIQEIVACARSAR